MLLMALLQALQQRQQAAVLAPLLSMEWPPRSTARYRYFHWPAATLMQVLSMRQLVPTGRLRYRNTAASIGRFFVAQRWTVA